MTTPAQIFTALQYQLQDSPYLNYVNDDSILLGTREGINLFPCIVIEPASKTEEFTKDVNESVDIRYYCTVNGVINTHIDRQLVGNDKHKGLLDLENDIKKAISSDHTLDGHAIDTLIHTSAPDIIEWPIRMVAIEVEIFFRQNRITRT